jgi:hypothetical protein
MSVGVRRLAVALVVTAASAVCGSAAADNPSADACAAASDDAQPLRKAGKLGEAKQRLLVCVNTSCPSVVRKDCTVQMNEIEAAIPTIVFGAKDSRGADVAVVTVTVDGAKLADQLDGRSLPVDPGQHRFRFEAAGEDPITKDLVIREGEKDRHESIVFGKSGASADHAATPSGPTPTSAGRSPAWALATLGVGAAGIVVGSVFGVLALHTKSTLDSECPSKVGCRQSDVDALSTRGWVSNIGFAVGIVGAGVGTVLLLTSGGKSQPSVAVQVGATSVGLSGTLP